MPRKKDYQTLSAELDEVLATLQQPDVQVADAIVLYERGLKLVAEIETYVSEAENKLERLHLQAGREDSN
jgi:exodeoxyribonuclease VII small subunit